jgi:hypothetical protein
MPASSHPGRQHPECKGDPDIVLMMAPPPWSIMMGSAWRMPTCSR